MLQPSPALTNARGTAGSSDENCSNRHGAEQARSSARRRGGTTEEGLSLTCPAGTPRFPPPRGCVAPTDTRNPLSYPPGRQIPPSRFVFCFSLSKLFYLLRCTISGPCQLFRKTCSPPLSPRSARCPHSGGGCPDLLALPGSTDREFERGEGGAREMRKKRGGGSGEVELPGTPKWDTWWTEDVLLREEPAGRGQAKECRGEHQLVIACSHSSTAFKIY